MVSNDLNEIQILSILKKKHIKCEIYCKDRLPKDMEDGYYIFNLDNYDQGGSHWTTGVVKNANLVYIDSFGVEPFTQLVSKFPDYKYNRIQVQDMHSSCCGYFAVAFLLSIRGQNPEQAIKMFIANFSPNTRMNDLLLERLLKSQGIF